MGKLLAQPLRLEVEENDRHQPIAFLYERRRESTEELIRRWRVNRGWWKKAIERDYFQIKTETGLVCELYRDLITGTWYLQRVCD